VINSQTIAAGDIVSGQEPDELVEVRRGDYVNVDPDEEGLWIIPPSSSEPKAPAGGAPAGQPGAKPRTPPQRPGAPPKEQPAGKPPQAAILAKKITNSRPVLMESCHELFRCFVRPSADLKLQRVKLGVDFELAVGPDQVVAADNPAIRVMQEAARQLGLEIDVQESEPSPTKLD
jgi:hypothetical protein